MAKKIKLPPDYFDFTVIGIAVDGYILTASEINKGILKWESSKQDGAYDGKKKRKDIYLMDEKGHTE